MRVLLVGNYPPPFGGVSVHTQLLHRLLLNQGIDSVVLNIDPRAKASEEYASARSYFQFLLKLILLGRGRVIHLHTNGHNPKSWIAALLCAWIGRLFGSGSMLTIHSGMAPGYITKSSFIKKLVVKLALFPQSLVVCVNNEIREALSSFGYKVSRTVLLPAFLFDERELSPLDNELKSRLSRFQPLLSLVAFFRPEYGVELLIDALAELSKKFPKIGCVIMGSGDDEMKLKRLAEEKGIADRILWLGDFEHGQCLSVIKASDLFVRPTLADGDSVSVREAAQLSVPVVASDVGYRPDSAQLFRCGDVTDLIAKCIEVLTGPKPVKRQEQSKKSNGLSILFDAYRQICSDGSSPVIKGHCESKHSI